MECICEVSIALSKNDINHFLKSIEKIETNVLLEIIIKAQKVTEFLNMLPNLPLNSYDKIIKYINKLRKNKSKILDSLAIQYKKEMDIDGLDKVDILRLIEQKELFLKKAPRDTRHIIELIRAEERQNMCKMLSKEIAKL